jgi:hypothetical protein
MARGINCVLLAITWTVGTASLARAQADGQPLTERGFNVDLVTGPVLGPGRIIGLGGAYTALADGIDGAAWNPAAYASRAVWGTSWFDWDLSLSVSPGTVGPVDFDNDGRSDAWRNDTTMGGTGDQSFQYGAAGLGLQFGALGVGLTFRSETYRIHLPGDQGNTQVSLLTFHFGGGYSLNDGQIVIGAGFRTAALTIGAPQLDATTGMQAMKNNLVNFTGTNLETGLLLRLTGKPWRLGAAARLPVVSVVPASNGPSQPITGVSALPKEVRLPWEVQLGFAWQFGPRPLNRRWENAHTVRDQLHETMQQRRRDRAQRQWELEQRQARTFGASPLAAPTTITLDPTMRTPSDPEWWKAEQVLRQQEANDYVHDEQAAERRRQLAVNSLAREYLLVTSEVIFVGRTQNGVGVESFLAGSRQTSGAAVSVGFRLGAELEPIAHWLKVRGGGYLEPSRYTDGSYRVHGTAGFDVRLFTWDLFGLMEPFILRTGATLDAAQRYTSFGLNLGVWH